MKKLITALLAISFSVLSAQDYRPTDWKYPQKVDSAETKTGYVNLVLDSATRALATKDDSGKIRKYIATNEPSGNVGIGTLNPDYKLDVNGRLRSDNSISDTLTLGSRAKGDTCSIQCDSLRGTMVWSQDLGRLIPTDTILTLRSKWTQNGDTLHPSNLSSEVPIVTGKHLTGS